jgi:hypothetical protein
MKKLWLLLPLIFIVGCADDDRGVNPVKTDKGDYVLAVKYDSIRAYPDGGGIFPVSISPGSGFEGSVTLRIEADPHLRASLSCMMLTKDAKVAEIVLRPDTLAELKHYPVRLTATHGGKDTSLVLGVELYHWGPVDREEAMVQRDRFKSWLTARNPAFVQLFEAPQLLFLTYPQILIVEHYTFLTRDYEFRLCRHVMVPPYDWAKILIRKRDTVTPELAAFCETSGNVSEIPVSEYPIIYGY